MNKRRKRYCSLGSIAEVRNERIKLSKMMKVNRKHLSEDWDDVSYWLSPSNLKEELMCRLSSQSSFFRNVVAGARTAMRMIGERRAGRCGCR